MRIGSVTIKGRSFPICLSVHVMMDLEEKGLTLKNVLERASEERVTELFFLLSRMLVAGYEWKRLNGEEAEQPPTLDEVAYLIGVDGAGDIIKALGWTLEDERKVEATPPKKKGGSSTNPPPHG